MTNDLFADVGYISLNHAGEELCGDKVEILRRPGDRDKSDELIVVLADGMGSGVKANILATLTSKIISTMIAEDLGIEECVKTVAATLPICRERGVAYSTFTIMRFADGRTAELIQFDNPQVILLRDSKNFDYPQIEKMIEGKKIFESRIELMPGDVLIAMSDGAIYAGNEMILNYGWQRENIIAFAEAEYDPAQPAKMIAARIADECDRLYDFKPGDDTTVCAVQIRERKSCALAFGPPSDPGDDEKMMSRFFETKGSHIVCGGTTAKIAAQYLGKDVVAVNDPGTGDVPPTAKIDGVDLVTEGAITLGRVLDYARDYLDDGNMLGEWKTQSDGASEITRLLSESTDISIFFGKARNDAHKDMRGLAFSIKVNIIKDLKECLEKIGKTVKIYYY